MSEVPFERRAPRRPADEATTVRSVAAPRSVVGTTVIVMAVVAAFVAAYMAVELLLLTFAGAMLAVLVTWPAEELARRTRLSRGVALLLAVIVAFGGLGLVFYLIGAQLVAQGQEMARTLPAAFASTGEQLSRTESGAWVVSQVERIRETAMRGISAGGFLSRVGGVLFSTVGIVGNFFVVMVLTIFFAANPGTYVNGVVHLFPRDRRARLQDVIGRAGHALRWWFFGQLISMTAVGILTWAGLAALGIPLALSLAALAALLNFIPNFGPIIAGIPAVVIALAPTDGAPGLNMQAALLVVVLYTVVQTLEGSVLTPLIQRRAIDIPPALLILSQLALTLFAGPLGLVLTTPIVAVALVFVRELYVRDGLGEGRPAT